MDNASVCSSNLCKDLEATLQAFSDLNVIVNHNGKILDFKPGHFSLHNFPQLSLGEKLQEFLSPVAAEKIEHALQTGRTQILNITSRSQIANIGSMPALPPFRNRNSCL
jgi:hypothetical protein